MFQNALKNSGSIFIKIVEDKHSKTLKMMCYEKHSVRYGLMWWKILGSSVRLCWLDPGQCRCNTLPSLQKVPLDSAALESSVKSTASRWLPTNHVQVSRGLKMTSSRTLCRAGPLIRALLPVLPSSQNLCHTSMIMFKLFCMFTQLFPPNRSALGFTSFHLSKSYLISTLFRLSMYCFILLSSFVTFERTGARLYPQSSAFSKWLVEMKTLCVTGAQSTTWGPNLAHCRLL